MNKNIRKAILSILLLQEEFTKEELAKAVQYISSDSSNDLFDYLVNSKQSTRKSSAPSKSVTDQTSRVILELKENDHDKYELLRNFDSLVRKGELLPRLDLVKKLGARLSKEFQAGKSRKESIPRLMGLLVDLPIIELENLINDVIGESGREKSEYADLAEYLIHGDSKSSTEK